MRVLIGLLVLGLAYVIWRVSSGPSKALPTSPGPTVQLRDMVLTRELFRGIPPAAGKEPRCVLMDWTIDDGNTATLVAFEDGATSLYYGTGGGIIGAGEHESVRTVAAAFRAAAARAAAHFHPSETFPLPPTHAVTFYLVSDSITLTAGPLSVEEQGNWNPDLSALGDLGQELIAAIRQVAPPAP